jgi:choline dehydrogenase
MLARKALRTITCIEVFDYVIVGAGTAGCVLAARLSEDPALQVLLIEAGPADRARAIRTPLSYPALFQTAVDWDFWTQAQAHLGNRHLYWPRGRTLGGSSSLNALVDSDPCEADIADWGVPEWTAAGLRALQADKPPVSTRRSAQQALNPLSQAFLDACEANGVPKRPLLTDAKESAAGAFRLSVKEGKRWSAADAYLRPALQRGNLTVWTGVQARRVICENGRATGVEYAQGGKVQVVQVTREVILSAGVVGSPHLLLLSGIGPQRDLELHRIPVAAAVPGVGLNLQDHLAAPLSYFSMQPVSLSGAHTFVNRWRHRLTGQGPLASNGAEVGATLRSTKETGACDLEIVFAAAHYVDHGFAHPGGHGFSVIPVLLKPAGRGRIHLHSADPDDAPLIDPAYLSNAADRDKLIEGVLFSRKLIDTKPLADYAALPVPGKVAEPTQHIVDWGQSLYHPVGTCKLGHDELSVVDPLLRVRDVKGLRVVDASVMPTIPRTHINTTVLLLAERAAQLIKS